MFGSAGHRYVATPLHIVNKQFCMLAWALIAMNDHNKLYTLNDIYSLLNPPSYPLLISISIITLLFPTLQLDSQNIPSYIPNLFLTAQDIFIFADC